MAMMSTPRKRLGDLDLGIARSTSASAMARGLRPAVARRACAGSDGGGGEGGRAEGGEGRVSGATMTVASCRGAAARGASNSGSKIPGGATGTGNGIRSVSGHSETPDFAIDGDVGVSFRPQPLQNLAPSRLSVWQSPHTTAMSSP
jgi:hypothetical protein